MEKQELKRYKQNWNKEHKEQVKGYKVKWRKNNKDKIKELNKKYKETHKEKIKEYNKRYSRKKSKISRKKSKISRTKQHLRERLNPIKSNAWKNDYRKRKRQCDLCGSDLNLQFHHTDYAKHKGVTLCLSCHRNLHKVKQLYARKMLVMEQPL